MYEQIVRNPSFILDNLTQKADITKMHGMLMLFIIIESKFAI